MKTTLTALMLFSLSAIAATPTPVQNGIALFDEGKLDEAKKVFDSLARTTSDPDVFYYLGRIDLARNAYSDAEAHLEKAVALQPSRADYHLFLADAYGTDAQQASVFRMPSLGKKAQAELETTVRLDPSLLAARFGLIDFYMQAPSFMGGSEDKAKEQAAEIRKRDVAAGHRALARIYTLQEHPELAEKEYVDWVKAEPSSPKSHYGLGVFYLTTKKDYKRAKPEFEAAAQADPAFMPAWFQIGHTAALTADDLPRGEESLRKYLASKPKHDEPSLARAVYWLGAIFEKEGRRDLARQQYEQSLRMQAGQKDVTEALKRVGR